VLILSVLLIAWAIFRLILGNWRGAGRWALAVMLLLTASAHFTSMRHELARMVPGWVPQPMTVIYVTGVLEVAAAIGLLLKRTRRIAGLCLCVLFVALFPANLKAGLEGWGTNLWLRAPMQLLFTWLAWWSTRERA
jgi:uncharacterized membrane protein